MYKPNLGESFILCHRIDCLVRRQPSVPQLELLPPLVCHKLPVAAHQPPAAVLVRGSDPPVCNPYRLAVRWLTGHFFWKADDEDLTRGTNGKGEEGMSCGQWRYEGMPRDQGRYGGHAPKGSLKGSAHVL